VLYLSRSGDGTDVRTLPPTAPVSIILLSRSLAEDDRGDSARRLRLHGGDRVTVDVQRQRYCGVPRDLADDLRMNPRAEGERAEGVPESRSELKAMS